MPVKDGSAPRLILVGGGVRCGKTAFALALAREGGARRTFIATGEGGDDEMRRRIARHVAERGGEFTTVEEPVALAAAFADAADGARSDVVVIDSLTFWIANLLVRGTPPAEVERAIDEVTEALARRAVHTIVVTSEVGLGLIGEHAVARAFADLTGAAHQRIARDADAIYFGALGVMLRLRPEPLAVVRAGDPPR